VVAVHQVLPVFGPRDAIGNHAVGMQRALSGMGLTAEIFAGEVMPGAGHGARTTRGARRSHGVDAGEPTVWIYHASTGSPVAEWWAAQPGLKVIDYHNISPPELIGAWEPHVGAELEHGRRQLTEMASVTDLGLADSMFNQAELLALGYRHTAVVPIFLDLDDTAPAPHDPSASGARWLFVSRILPHKAQHDVLKAFAVYRRVFDRAARLTLVGSVGSHRYAEALEDFITDLDLDDAVARPGSVSTETLTDCYRSADVYVSLSEHEGFGVPLLEAMAHGVPIVAYACAAVPETAGEAALLLENKAPTTVAIAVHRVLTDVALHDVLVRAGRRRLRSFGAASTTERLRRALARLLANAGVVAPTSLVLARHT